MIDVEAQTPPKAADTQMDSQTDTTQTYMQPQSRPQTIPTAPQVQEPPLAAFQWPQKKSQTDTTQTYMQPQSQPQTIPTAPKVQEPPLAAFQWPPSPLALIETFIPPTVQSYMQPQNQTKTKPTTPEVQEQTSPTLQWPPSIFQGSPSASAIIGSASAMIESASALIGSPSTLGGTPSPLVGTPTPPAVKFKASPMPPAVQRSPPATPGANHASARTVQAGNMRLNASSASALAHNDSQAMLQKPIELGLKRQDSVMLFAKPSLTNTIMEDEEEGNGSITDQVDTNRVSIHQTGKDGENSVVEVS